ncbi:MAG TPA: glycosyltransferase family 2 protein [Solirubrobacteraceae bacterium]
MSGAVAVVVVAHDSAGELGGSLGALRDQLREGDEVVVVDSGSSDGSAEVARRVLPEARVVDAGGNVGFAAGCNRGVGATSAPLVLLLNPDCVAQPGFLDALRAAAADRPGWAAWQALVTLPGGDRVNTAGNVVHFLGFGWVGGLDRPVAEVPREPHEVPFASGAAMMVRREAWERAGGFDERYFMYGEDLDLSLRLRLAGHGIGVVPDARCEHEYSFTKGDYKWFYLERNRWWTILRTYPAAVIAVALPGLLAFEVALLAWSARDGWLRAKLRAQAAVARELPAILARRRAIQATRAESATAFASHLTASLDSPHLAGAAKLPGVVRLLRLYWRIALALLRAIAAR